jgi:D-alanyl-D-alanine dipeptidase
MLLEPGQNHRTGLIRRVGFRENSREWTHFDQRVEAARFFFDY